MRVEKAFAGSMAVGLSLTLVPLGCGAGNANEDYTVVNNPSSELATTHAWAISEPVVEEMQACTKTHARELRSYNHAAKFDLRVADNGDVEKVELRSSTLHHETLESCLMQALTTVSIPSSVLTLRSSGPMSGGESSPESREQLGIVQVLAGAVAAGPVILIAAGVTIAVYVAAVATDVAIEAAKRRTKREKWCYEQLYACVGHQLECSACFLECKRHGVWDERKCPLSTSN